MEMQEMDIERDRDKEGDGAKTPVLKVQKTEEEAQPDHYTKLCRPAEDVYTEAHFGDSSVKAKAGEAESDHYSKLQNPAETIYAETHFGDSPDKQTVGNVRLYRVGCLVLTVVCLVLLLVVILLSMKVQTVCPVRGEAEADIPDPTCSYEQCKAHINEVQGHKLGCRQCADGWLTFGRSCFYLSTHRLSWQESQKNCSARGGALAVITSQKVQNFLTQNGRLMYWIGLIHKGDKWSWVTNDPLQKSYWAENVSPGDCGLLNARAPPGKNWLRDSCESYSYFICQLQF